VNKQGGSGTDPQPWIAQDLRESRKGVAKRQSQRLQPRQWIKSDAQCFHVNLLRFESLLRNTPVSDDYSVEIPF
jgi:hypothetical protein